MYMTYKLFKNIWAVWTVALLIITFNDYGILGQMMAWAFEGIVRNAPLRKKRFMFYKIV